MGRYVRNCVGFAMERDGYGHVCRYFAKTAVILRLRERASPYLVKKIVIQPTF